MFLSTLKRHMCVLLWLVSEAAGLLVVSDCYAEVVLAKGLRARIVLNYVDNVFTD